MSGKLDKFIKNMPKELKPASNPMLNALLRAWSGEDDAIMEQLRNTKAQLFVKTAEGIYLDRLASNFGVSRPVSLGLIDADFQRLIPNLSLKQKQVVKSFYDTMDVFWGPHFSRANVNTTLPETYALNVGDSFEVRIDGGATQKVTILAGDIRMPGAVTAAEVARILGRVVGMTSEVFEDQATGDQKLNLRTDTPGPRGAIEFVSGFAALGVTQGFKYRLNNLAQRTAIYQVNPGELIIELPAIVPVLRRTLKGSHHFHADSTLESAIPPSDGQWVGSFSYSTEENPFIATSIKSTLLSNVLKGDVINEITVADTTGFPAAGGKLVFDFGKTNQETPVSFLAVPNTNTILIDPGYSFQDNHLAGSFVNLLAPGQTTPYKPSADGTDYAIYLTSPANSRDLVEEILRSLAAAGITITFIVLLPKYTYLIDNPFSV